MAAADVEERAQIARVLEGVTTRTGTSRRARVQRCGCLYVARQGGTYGVAHKWCRDRACPACMRRRQRVEAGLLHRYARHRIDEGATLVFPTLTQIKMPVEYEGAKVAVERLMGSRRRLMNTKTKAGRALRKYFVGGLWALEATWSPRGKRNRDGSAVAYSGFHPHLHGVLELSPPPPGRSIEGWAREAQARLVQAWIELNPEGSAEAQHVAVVDADRIGEVAKYPLKPFEVSNPTRQRELLVAVVGKRTLEGWGAWKSWKREAKRLREQDQIAAGESEPEPVRIGDQTLSQLLTYNDLHWDVTWSLGDRELHRVKADRVVAAIRGSPKILNAPGPEP